VRVTAHGSPGEVDEKLARLGERVRAPNRDYCSRRGGDHGAVVEELLRTRGWKLATAES